MRNNLNVVLKRLAAEPFFGNYKLQTVGDVSINNHPRLGRARHLRVTRNLIFKKIGFIMKNNKTCLWCKVEFVPRAAGRPQKYCSKLCKRKYEKEIRKLGLDILKMKSPILNAHVNEKEER